MPCQVQVLLYGPATYRSDVLPELPPTNRTDALVGRLRTPLRWGHYAQRRKGDRFIFSYTYDRLS